MAPEPALQAARLQVLYYNQSHFRSALLTLRQSGGRKTAAAMRLLNLIQQAGQGIDSFASLAASPDARIENALIYVLNEEARLVAIKSNSTAHLCFCGTPAEVESWLQANDGLTLAVDGETLRIDATIVTNTQAKAVLAPTQLTEDNQPFLTRFKGLDLASFVSSSLVRRLLLGLNENSTEDEIREVLGAVPDEDARLFLHDVLSLAKAGDTSGAEARIRLRKGESCPVIDAQGMTQNAIASDANCDQVIILNDLDPRELERLLDPTHFQEWMLFLHPDQRRVAEADFDKPVVLTGVSGSGKTCILVHRARHLARKYPGERIGILTLNRSLARLLRNLVDQLCLEGEAKNIHVMAFYDYFSQLLNNLGPGEYLNQLSEEADESAVMQEVIRAVNVKRLAREFDPLSGETTEDTWNDFYGSQNPDVKDWFADVFRHLEEYRLDASRYLREEFTLVRSAFPISDRSRGFAAFERTGRSIPLQAKLRSDILRLLLFFEEYMLAGEVLDVLELTLAVTPLWRHIRGSTTLSLDDLKNPASFAKRLLSPTADLLSAYIFCKLSDQTRREFKTWQRTEPLPQSLHEALVGDLNSIIRERSIWHKGRFPHVTLSAATRELIDQNPQGLDVVSLNRLLIGDAYPEEVNHQTRDLREDEKFRCLLVDEFQDFSTLDLRLLMWVPPRDAENGLFLAGDPIQKILVKRLNLRDAGLASGSAIYRCIKKNYRNSRQILRAASKLANVYGELARSSGEDIEVLDPELAVRETAKPIALKTDKQVKKAWEIVRQCLAEGQTQAWTICIATTSAHKYSADAVLAMRPPSMEAEVLSGDYIKKPDTVVVSALNDLKGFEFNLVVIIGCDEGICPANGVAEGEIWRDALRFYVCMTRARDQVFMLYEGSPSEFLRQMNDQIVWTEEALRQDYEPTPINPAAVPTGKRIGFTHRPANKDLGLHTPCFEKFSRDSLAIIRLFYNTDVDDSKWMDCRGYNTKEMDELERQRTEAFHRWVTPSNLRQLRPSRFSRWPQIGRRALMKLDQELRRLGVTGFFVRK